MTTETKDWEPNLLVQCPCCNNEFETDDYMPFSEGKWNLHCGAEHAAAERDRLREVKAELLAALEKIAETAERNAPHMPNIPGAREAMDFIGRKARAVIARSEQTE